MNPFPTDAQLQGEPTIRLAVLGATGSVGRELVTQALAAGHEVTALVVRRDSRSFSRPRGWGRGPQGYGVRGDSVLRPATAKAETAVPSPMIESTATSGRQPFISY
jgi:nucleoside-diphosphate-sugar epimerase